MRGRPVTCCFSGYRPGKLPWGGREDDPRCLALKARLRRAIEEAWDQGYRHFICGMAEGVDLYCCELLLELRRTRPLTVEAAIPCLTQADGWTREQRERYRRLVASCDLETVVQEQYSAGCMQRRNRYMVDHSARLIAVFDGQAGGTQATVRYAMSRRLELVLIPPEELLPQREDAK